MVPWDPMEATSSVIGLCVEKYLHYGREVHLHSLVQGFQGLIKHAPHQCEVGVAGGDFLTLCMPQALSLALFVLLCLIRDAPYSSRIACEQLDPCEVSARPKSSL